MPECDMDSASKRLDGPAAVGASASTETSGDARRGCERRGDRTGVSRIQPGGHCRLAASIKAVGLLLDDQRKMTCFRANIGQPYVA